MSDSRGGKPGRELLRVRDEDMSRDWRICSGRSKRVQSGLCPALKEVVFAALRRAYSRRHVE